MGNTAVNGKRQYRILTLQSATNSKAHATYLNGARRASWSSRPCNNGRCVVSHIHPNASTHGPPTSSAVQVNLEIPVAVTDGFRPTGPPTQTQVSGRKCQFSLFKVVDWRGTVWQFQAHASPIATRICRSDLPCDEPGGPPGENLSR